MTFTRASLDPLSPHTPVRSVPDVERLRRLAMVDRAIATHDEVMRRTMGAPCAPA